jgi:hypothetical protein
MMNAVIDRDGSWTPEVVGPHVLTATIEPTLSNGVWRASVSVNGDRRGGWLQVDQPGRHPGDFVVREIVILSGTDTVTASGPAILFLEPIA